MGTSQSKSKTHRHFRNTVDANWQVIGNEQNYQIVENLKDETEGQFHTYTLNNRYDPQGQPYFFQLRKRSSYPIVKVLDYQWKAKGTTLSPENNFKVVTERLPYRLCNCPQLTIDESLYVLDKALEGYEYLYHKSGPFDISSEMIAFTLIGQAKVWYNQNFGSNYPYHEKRTLRSTTVDKTHRYTDLPTPWQEIEMVRNIINVIEDRCQEGQFHYDFRQKIRQNIGFRQARQIVSDELQFPERIRITRIDFEHNTVKTKFSSLRSHQSGEINFIYTDNFNHSQLINSYVFIKPSSSLSRISTNINSSEVVELVSRKCIPI